MNHNVTQGARGPLTRMGRRVAAIVAECNYAQTRVDNLRKSPTRICLGGSSTRRQVGPGLRAVAAAG